MTLTDMILKVLRVLGASGVLAGLVLLALWVPNQPEKDLRGQWATQGSGLIFDIGRAKITVFEVTSSSCRIGARMPAHLGLARRFAGYTFTRKGDQLQIDVADMAVPITAIRQTTLPALCTGGAPAGPREVFLTFWDSFETHYPNFDEHDVNWPGRLHTGLATIGQSIDPQRVETAIETALLGLDDPNIQFATPDRRSSPHTSAPWVEHQQAYWAATDAYLIAPPEHINTAGIRHGWLDTSITFISIHHMNTDPAFGKHMSDEALRVVTELTQTYQDAAGIVLDLRFATGGSDKVALTYASAFSDNLFVAGYKATQMAHEQFTQNTPLWVTSTQTPLRQPVIALISSETMGASEVLVAALKSLQNITVMGMPTAGAPSDILGRTLPNGWKFTLPHQRFFMANGDLVGTSGIAPDILLPFDAEAFSQGKDTALEAAIAHLLAQ